MAEDDIYGSKKKYERFISNLEELLLPPDERKVYLKNSRNRGKYYCKNKNNLVYFKKLADRFESKDLSYVRRNRLFDDLKLIVYYTDIDLKDFQREDIDKILGYMHKNYASIESKKPFIKHLKLIWKILFPEKDEKGRIDNMIVPYPVRHLSGKLDKSKEKRREDKLTYEEFEKLVNYFSSDPRIQCYLMLALESLGRPQEILYTRIKDIEAYDNYAKIHISSHGKEGVGFLQSIDSFPYLQKWLEVHPFKNRKDSFIFVNTGRTNFSNQLTPFNIGKKLKIACKDLGIDKPITAYSLKRSGVTFRRIRGDSDVQIQRVARWTSTSQLKTYDLSDQEDGLKISLVQKGLLQDEKFKQYEPKTRTCPFCKEINGFSEIFCHKCKRPLDRKIIEEEFKQKELNYDLMKQELEGMKAKINELEIIKRLSRVSPEAIQKVIETMEKMEKIEK